MHPDRIANLLNSWADDCVRLEYRVEHVEGERNSYRELLLRSLDALKHVMAQRDTAWATIARQRDEIAGLSAQLQTRPSPIGYGQCPPLRSFDDPSEAVQ